MPTSLKTCYLFTQSFPFGNSEVFVEREIPFLSAYFEKVVVFPMERGRGEAISLPENVHFHYLFGNKLQEYKAIEILFGNFVSVTNILLQELIFHPFGTVRQFRTLFSDLLQQFYHAKKLEHYLSAEQTKEGVFYSYWFDRWATILGILKTKQTNLKFSSRAHAFDLYEEDNRLSYILFRRFQLKSVEKVYAVSQQGAKYLGERYPKFQRKIDCSHLGSSYHNFVNPFPGQNDGLVLLSCGSVQQRKRTLLIPEILEKLKFKYKWVHFGSGPDLQELKNKIQRLGISASVELKGHVSNEDFVEYLKNKPVSLFISVSANEGLPYTMMEATSCGIPLMSTDVGGCAEICTEITGILLKKNFRPEEVAKKIGEFMNSEKNTTEFRTGVRKFWEDNFSAQKNYTEFYSRIS